MIGVKPDKKMWARVNAAIMGDNAAVALVTLTSGLCALLVDAGVAADEPHARAHLAAILLSPDTATKPGSLLHLLHAEIARLDDGKWLT